MSVAADQLTDASPAAASANPIARRARTLFFWALGLCIVFWLIPIGLTFVPAPEAQTAGILMVWAGFLPTVVVAVLAIVFGAIGLSRSRALEGAGRTEALTGLIGGIGVFVVPGVLAFLAIAIMLIVSSVMR